MKRLLAAFLLGLAAPVSAQTTEAQALTLAQAYHDTHNRHDLAVTMAFYAEDATFQLNMGRPQVRGRAAITELERFDAIAGSSLFPHGWRVERQGARWAIHADGVIEHSRIFESLGLPVVVAVPDAPVLILEQGRIVHINQPPLRAACTGEIVAGFTALAKWLETSASPLAPALVAEGRLVLKPELLPVIISQVSLWRARSGWSPDAARRRACAEPVSAASPP